MVSDMFFDTLRTKEQLGYIVTSRISVNEDVLAFETIIQSSVKPPCYLS